MGKYLDLMTQPEALYKSMLKCSKESYWKESVQKVSINEIANIFNLRNELLNGTYKQKGFHTFTIHERGKTRCIRSIHVIDRIVQRSMCDYVLLPVLRKYLIYDNGASLKDKGVDFTRKRLKSHLEKFKREYGTNGYVLLLDFSKFFDNIPHDKLIEMIRPYFEKEDKEFWKLLVYLIGTFTVDVSYMSDEEYAHINDKPFDSNVHTFKRKQSKVYGKKFFHKSLGIGSQISQIFGLFYPTQIDNYCKIVEGLKYYGRYMDDIYIIHHDKNYLKKLAKKLYALSREMGMFINQTKTQIIKLTSTFIFMKHKYRITKSGKIKIRSSSERYRRELIKLRKYKKLLNNKRLSFIEILNAYSSWSGQFSNILGAKSIHKLDTSFFLIYHNEINKSRMLYKANMLYMKDIFLCLKMMNECVSNKEYLI